MGDPLQMFQLALAGMAIVAAMVSFYSGYLLVLQPLARTISLE